MSEATLKGSIQIATKSVEDAIKEINRLNGGLQSLAKQNEAYLKTVQQKTNVERVAVRATQDKVKADEANARLTQRNQNLIERAANTVANYTQQIKRANIDEGQRQRLLTQSSAALRVYSGAVMSAEGDSLKLQTASTRLGGALGNLSRIMKEQVTVKKEGSTSAAATERALGSLEAQYFRLSNAISASALDDEKKAAEQARLTQAYERSRAGLQRFQAGTVDGVRSQNEFRRATINTTEAVRQANRAFRGQEIELFNNRFRDLVSSVQVALGPLSGVASRLTALGGLFRRNAAAIGALLAATTGFSVTLSQTLKVGAEAERQMLSMEAQLRVLGLTAQITSRDMDDMAHRIAAATLTSAAEVRGAQQTLLEFSNIGVRAFEDTLMAAQGLTTAFGGTLQSNIQRIGRLLNNPIENFNILNRQGIEFTQIERERIAVLQRTGQLQEAQAIIMDRFASSIEAAKGSALGLSGALDTLSGNADKLFQVLFETEGVAVVAAKAVQDLADAVKAFSESDNAVLLAKAFELVLSSAANAARFFSDNVANLSWFLTALVGVTLVKAVAVTLRLIASVTGLTSVTTRAIAAFRGMSVAASGATASMNLFTRAATIARGALAGFGPAGWVAFGLVSTASYLAARAFSRVKDEIGGVDIAIKRLDSSTRLLIESLSDDQKIALADQIDEFGRNTRLLDATTARISAAKEEVEALEEQFVKLNDGKSILALEAQLRRLQNVDQSTMNAQTLRNVQDSIENTSKAIAEYERTIRPLRHEIVDLSVDKMLLTERGEALRASMQEGARDNAEAAMSFEQLSKATEELLEKTKAMTSADTQRIQSAQNYRTQLEQQLQAVKGNDEAAKKYADELRGQIVAMDEYIETLRKSTRAAQEEARQKERLAAIYANLEDMQKRAKAFNESGTQAALDRAMADLERTRRNNELKASIEQLTKVQQIELAQRLKIQDIAEDEAALLEQVTAAYIEQADAMSQAERSSQALFDLREKLNDVEGRGAGELQRLTKEYQRNAEEMQRAFEEFKIGGADEAEIEAMRQRVNAAMQMMTEDQLREIEKLNMRTEELVRMNPMTDLERLTQDYQQRRLALQEIYGNESEDLERHLADLTRQYESQKAFEIFTTAAKNSADVFQGVTQLMSSAGRQQTKQYQYIALAQATMAQGVAIAKAWQEGGPYMGPILAGLAAANVGAQIASIQAQQFSTGGFVSGKGTGTSDSIPAWLSNGEYVINAKAVSMLGKGFLDMLNGGDMPAFATGGSVTRVPVPVSSGPSQSGGVNVQIINQTSQQFDNVDVEQSYDLDGELQLRVFIRDAVREEMNAGGFDSTMRDNFGQRRRATRR